VNTLTPDEFEQVLNRACAILTDNLRASTAYHDPDLFQQQVQDTLRLAANELGMQVGPSFHPHAFPDITANGFGVEVKYTKNDSWQSVGNSIFEGMRDPSAETIYVVLGKTGGVPEARWARYEDCISHVRVSHAPRFVVDLGGGSSRLFDHISVSYGDFAQLPDDDKMRHIREYSRGRLPPSERLWWLEAAHTVPVGVRLYTRLTQEEKRSYRAEAAVLFPQVCASRYTRGKYDDASLYLLMHHGVFCPQARDLWTAGSVAGSTGDGNNPEGPYILHALSGIQDLMREAALRLDDNLIEEYWGEPCKPDERIATWLRKSDAFASDWVPSEHLFKD
jgi:hypothetical protein